MVTTYNAGFYSSDGNEPAALSICNQEEGDYRVLLHRENMSKKGVNRAMIFTPDKRCHSNCYISLLWVKSTANRKYIPIHKIVKSLDPERAGYLTLFHILAGCDQVSFFSSCEKKAAWETWQNYQRLTESLAKLCNNPTAEVIESEINTIERFVCLIYHAASTKSVQYGRQLENSPPTQYSMKQHVLRVLYQANFVWVQFLILL